MVSTGSTLPSALPDWSEETLCAPTEAADSFDFNDGETSREPLPVDGDGVRSTALDIVDAAERVVELLSVLAVLLDLEEKLEGGDFGRKNCLGCFRKLSPGARPRRCFSEGLGESATSEAVASESFDNPENER